MGKKQEVAKEQGSHGVQGSSGAGAGQKPQGSQSGGKPVQEERVEGVISFFDGIPAEVKELVTRAGTRGELTQVMCQILDGRDKNKAIRRNVKGPIQVGDILMLMETEIEAQRVGGGPRKGGPGASSGGSSGGKSGGGKSGGKGGARSGGKSSPRGARS